MPKDNILMVRGKGGSRTSEIRAYTATSGVAQENSRSYWERLTPGDSVGLPAGRQVEVLVSRRGLGLGFRCCCPLGHLEVDGFWFASDDLDRTRIASGYFILGRCLKWRGDLARCRAWVGTPPRPRASKATA